LLWRVFQERWPHTARLVTLLDDRTVRASLESSTATRLRFGAQLAVAQAGGQCDWVMYSHLAVAKVQAFVPAPLRKPYGIFIHGIEVWRPLSEAQESVLKGASLRVANSSFTADRVRAMHPALGRIEVCPLALPPERLAAIDAEASGSSGIDLGPRAVIAVARMSSDERYKGHDELLDVWPSVVARMPDARLAFVGDGDDTERLRQRALSLGVHDSVLFPGFVSAAVLQECYRRAAVFAMPSRGEGFGLVYLEAMAHALPCIGAWDDAARDIIRDGETGFLVPQSDRAALADRLVRLLGDAALRASMGHAGRRALDERFSYTRFSTGILELIDHHLEAPAALCRSGAAV
jgi:phosphatidylinositol alpha-1,6-mannosyltransferase